MADRHPRLAFAGDRDVAVNVLAFLLTRGDIPSAVLLPDEGSASHDSAILRTCEEAGVSPLVMRAHQLQSQTAIEQLHGLQLDYIVCVHFPYLIRRPVLEAAGVGVLNLHPAYLPYNRGWHTPSWAILDGTPAGATLHFMDESLDAGDIVYQQQVAIEPDDTAHTLYRRLLALEALVFREGWQRLVTGHARRLPQAGDRATLHRRMDLLEPAVQKLDLDTPMRVGELLRRLRALTTSRIDEAAYFESDGRKYRVQIAIIREDRAEEQEEEARRRSHASMSSER
jgi:methionyl-tRNA formyltransferase